MPVTLKHSLVALVVLSVTACAINFPREAEKLGASPEQAERYEQQLEAVVTTISKQPEHYQLALNTRADQKWLAAVTYKYWSGQLSREEFVAQGELRFPEHRPTFEMMADQLKPEQ